MLFNLVIQIQIFSRKIIYRRTKLEEILFNLVKERIIDHLNKRKKLKKAIKIVQSKLLNISDESIKIKIKEFVSKKIDGFHKKFKNWIKLMKTYVILNS